MKKIFLTLLLLLISNLGFGQIYKWRASLFSFRILKDASTWTGWKDWTPSGVLIVAESQNQRVKIYSSTEQTYDMIESVSKHQDSNGNPIFKVTCVNEDNVKCDMIWYHNVTEGSFVIFEFPDKELMYKVESLNN
jgi:hypothetical protein